MPISKIPVGAIQSGTIGTSQIADNAVTTAKILNDNVTSAKIPNDAIGSTEIAASAVTRDELQSAAVNNISSDSIILNSTNGTADAGDFLVLDGTDGAGANANHRILFDETFVDKIGLFNINTLGAAGTALKVDTAGTGFEFGSAGGFVKLLSSTSSSGVANFDIDSTYINSTYDNYKIIAGYTHATDNTRALLKFFVGGAVKQTDYSYENAAGTSSTYEYDADDATFMGIGGLSGNATGEVNTLIFDLTNVNSTTVATRIHGFHYGSATNGATVGRFFQAGQDVSNVGEVVNGLRIFSSSGNITMNTFAIYGLVK